MTTIQRAEAAVVRAAMQLCKRVDGNVLEVTVRQWNDLVAVCGRLADLKRSRK